MKRKVLSGSSLLLMAALAFGGFSFAKGKGADAPSAGGGLITVMNPAITGKMAERFSLAPRLNSIEGKTIYMVDIQWGGPEAAYSVYEEMQAWFAKNMPSVKTVIRRTTDNMFADDPGLRKEITDRKVDAVIVGIAG